MLKHVKKSITSYEWILLIILSFIVLLYFASILSSALGLKISDTLELTWMIFFLPNVALFSVVNEYLILGIVVNFIFYVILLSFPIAGYFWTEKGTKNLRLHQALVILILLYIFMFIGMMTDLFAAAASV